MATIRVYPVEGEPYDTTVKNFAEIDKLCNVPELSRETKTFVAHEVEVEGGREARLWLQAVMDESGRSKNLPRNPHAPAFVGTVAVVLSMEVDGPDAGDDEVELPCDGCVSYTRLFTAAALDKAMLGYKQIQDLNHAVVERFEGGGGLSFRDMQKLGATEQRMRHECMPTVDAESARVLVREVLAE